MNALGLHATPWVMKKLGGSYGTFKSARIFKMVTRTSPRKS
nr:hypothetical protein [Nonlabens ulvanivorans]